MAELAKKFKMKINEHLSREKEQSMPIRLPILPEHITRKIISFVPIKDNCFLVNKTFEEEAIELIRHRCFLKLNRNTVKTSYKNYN